jgi:hypothetical protein
MNAPQLTTSTKDSAERPSGATLAVAWLFLVTLAVVGRAWQPGWNITPMTAVSLAAGAMFPSVLLAASVPVVSMALGNLFLQPYDHPLFAVIMFAGFTWPVLLGRLGFLGDVGRGTRWLNVALCGAIPSLIVYPLSDAAHWLLTDMYRKTAEGFVTCLSAGLPFYRWAPVGDVAWSLGVFGILAGMVVAGNALAERRLAPASIVRGGSRLTGGSPD